LWSTRLRRSAAIPGVIRDTLAQVRRESESAVKRLMGERSALERQIRVEFADQGKLALASDPRLVDSHERIRLAEARLAAIRDEILRYESGGIEESDLIEALHRFDGVWDSLSPREQLRVIELLVEQVSCDGRFGKLSITYCPVGVHGFADEFSNHQEALHGNH